jgi:WD40 repeat protein
MDQAPSAAAAGELGRSANDVEKSMRPGALALLSVGLFVAGEPTAVGQQPKERATLQGPAATISAVTFAPDGKLLASSSDDGTIILWDVATGKRRATLKMAGAAPLAFSPDGKTLAAGGWPDITLWDVATGKVKATLKGHTAFVRCVAFSPDGKTLASGADSKTVSFSLAADTTIKLWDVGTGKERATLKGHTAPVYSVAFSPDGKTLTSGSWDKTIRLWEAATGKEKKALKQSDHVTALAFSPDGKTLASGRTRASESDERVRVLDAATGEDRAALKGHTSDVGCLAYSADGKLLASGSIDGVIKLWDVAASKERATVKGDAVSVYSLAFSPDGKLLAAGGSTGAVKLWDVAAGEQRPDK